MSSTSPLVPETSAHGYRFHGTELCCRFCILNIAYGPPCENSPTQTSESCVLLFFLSAHHQPVPVYKSETRLSLDFNECFRRVQNSRKKSIQPMFLVSLHD